MDYVKMVDNSFKKSIENMRRMLYSKDWQQDKQDKQIGGNNMLECKYVVDEHIVVNDVQYRIDDVVEIQTIHVGGFECNEYIGRITKIGLDCRTNKVKSITLDCSKVRESIIREFELIEIDWIGKIEEDE